MKVKKILVTAVTIGIVSSFCFGVQAAEDDTIQKGIMIGGIDVSGMTPEAARGGCRGEGRNG